MNLEESRRPRNRAIQRRVRARMATTGETYQQALQAIRAQIQPGTDNDLPPVA